MRIILICILSILPSVCCSSSYLHKYYIDNTIADHKLRIETLLENRLRASILPQTIELPNVTEPIYRAIEEIPYREPILDPCYRPILNQDPYNTPKCR